jgi:hemerythrin-like domain-containing protein
MTNPYDPSKRIFLQRAGVTGLILSGGLVTPALGAQRKRRGDRGAPSTEGRNAKNKIELPEVTPPEDLMREHGVLNRVLLIYEEGMRKFSANEDFDPAVLVGGAEIIRDFIENYHEKNEETYVFPRFQRAGKMVDLVNTLRDQHAAGRRLTATIISTARNSRNEGEDRNKVVAAMQAFIRMYRPHEAREDTELFPHFREIVSANEFDSMAEVFEREEHRLFGGDGFEKMTDKVAGLERKISINDLNQFTPAA